MSTDLSTLRRLVVGLLLGAAGSFVSAYVGALLRRQQTHRPRG